MYTAKKNKSYVLRVCDKKLQSNGGFQWKSKGFVSCDDFIAKADCGNGLHGWLDGIGDSTIARFNKYSKWLVLEVSTKDIINLNGKVKFPKCEVIFCGTKTKAVKFLYEITNKQGIIYQKLKGHNVVVGDLGKATAGRFGEATAGFDGTATAGNGGKATAGRFGTATAGDLGTATVGDDGTATAGGFGTAKAGYLGTATAGVRGTAKVNDNGTAKAGRGGRATAGTRGTATVGDNGEATAGYRGTATAGDNGKAKAGHWGIVKAGDNGTATAGDWGTAKAGRFGTATAGYLGTVTAGRGGKCYLTDNVGYWIPKLNTTCTMGDKVFHSKDYKLGVKIEIRL